MELADPGLPGRITVTRISANAARVFGTSPAMGRWFVPADDHPGSLFAVLSHAAWRRRFAADPGVLGRTVRLDRKACTIVGVMPSDFVFPLRGSHAQRSELWV